MEKRRSRRRAARSRPALPPIFITKDPPVLVSRDSRQLFLPEKLIRNDALARSAQTAARRLLASLKTPGEVLAAAEGGSPASAIEAALYKIRGLMTMAAPLPVGLRRKLIAWTQADRDRRRALFLDALTFTARHPNWRPRR